MIFLTIGTHEPFQRLVSAVDDWYATTDGSQELFGQITTVGTETHMPVNFQAVDRLGPSDYTARFEQADLIVAHAGMGSILTALSKAKPIVIMPRRGHLKETRNDHQFTTVKALGERPGIYVAMDETEIPNVMDRAVAEISTEKAAPVSNVADPKFTQALHNFLCNPTEIPDK